ncbi:acetolactate decarboxylase [Lactobacillus sp. PV034]|uniref:acetolactate decarboxylase n=1 Tax=Lactobacillus sp. PV034 TaxID=2594495 RepID=UPI002240315B|nr:acetolactate decarboxylase [Lactobacillus sp. PV034]QNQ80438.1 acetolactate decarboxylase [Lactobacillus sp. PV034]
MRTLFEHGTLATLMAANLDGTITLEELLKHGSQGLGTFVGLDGEVVILDGKVYQAVSSGKVNEITNMKQKLPFASVHFPKPQEKIELAKANFEIINKELPEKYELRNVFAALKLDGTFPLVHTRIAAKQVKPYPSLLEVAQDQAEFTYENLKGTIVGYYAPEIFNSVTAGGWHLHFISDDRQVAGHLLEFQGQNLTGNLEVFDTFEQHFPIEDQEFRRGNVNLETLKADIAASEGNND